MGRRPLNRFELRAQAEAAERLAPNTPPVSGRVEKPKSDFEDRHAHSPGVRMKLVWAVCDMGGRTVAWFDYPRKADAEALVEDLKKCGKGKHFVRSLKQPMDDVRPKDDDF